MAIISILDSNNVVVNVIELELNSKWQPPENYKIGPEGGPIGWIWDGKKYYDPNPIQLKIPTQVTAYQAKMALLNANLYQTVESLVISSQDQALKIAWNNANMFDRQSPFITSIGNELNLSNDQIDDLFISASKIT